MLILILLSALFCTIESQISHIPGVACGNTKPAARVVGGVDVTVEQVPWNAVIEIKKKENEAKIITNCGGVIISKTAILTAAHCVWLNRLSCPENVRNQESAIECHQLEGGCPNGCVRMRPQDLNVYVGINNITQSDRVPLPIERIILHQMWNKSSYFSDNIKKGHDLAIILLKDELEFSSRISPICIPDEQLLLESGQNVFVNGFGVTDVETRTLAEHLQSGLLQIKDKDECNDEYDALSTRATKRIIQGDQLCAYADGIDSCSGDSGSGLVKFEDAIPVLVGILSFGPKYCRNYPGVYTNVKSHVEWIFKMLKDFPQTSKKCSEKETCEARQTCKYIQQKYKEALETNSREQRKSIVNMLKGLVCNKVKKGFCCPEE